MGLVITAGHPREVWEPGEADQIASLLKMGFGQELSLGSPGEFISSDTIFNTELGWSWWSELQQLARSMIGDDGCVHLCSVDAWMGVYLDVPTGPMLLPMKPEHAGPEDDGDTGPIRRFLNRVLGGSNAKEKRKSDSADLDPELRAVLDQMYASYGPREGAKGMLQVGSLRELVQELSQLCLAMDFEPNDRSMLQVGLKYVENDELIDDDPEVQALANV